MRTIYKYSIPIQDKITIKMPEDSQVLTCQIQDGMPFIWAFVDPEKELIDRKFLLIGTGHEFPKKFITRYVATFQIGMFVGHLFEEIGEN